MITTNRLASIAAVAGLAAVGVTIMPHDAKAWWRGGIGFGVVLPPVVVGPAPVYAAPVYAPPYYASPYYASPYYAAPPVVYAPPPAYVAPAGRVWIAPHWQGSAWVAGHWS